ncbi:MAG: hypothetical protein NWE93_12875 [Candidatus Bathyarchaeota archaeon]|nr:hypothetical protein [Candidatus Bathyarchaeota archaeon]
MVKVAWQTFKETNPSSTYVAYAAYVERKSVWSYFNFLMRARKIQKQLNTSAGVVGFTAQMEFLNKKVSQLAVFEDEATLKAFAHSGQHSLCIQQSKPSIKTMKNKIWTISGAELPPKLEEAISKLQNQK